MKALSFFMAVVLFVFCVAVLFTPPTEDGTIPIQTTFTNVMQRCSTFAMRCEQLPVLTHYQVMLSDIRALQQDRKWYDIISNVTDGATLFFDATIGGVLAVGESIYIITTATAELFGFNVTVPTGRRGER